MGFNLSSNLYVVVLILAGDNNFFVAGYYFCARWACMLACFKKCNSLAYQLNELGLIVCACGDLCCLLLSFEF